MNNSSNKPVVYFGGEPVFWSWTEDVEVARLEIVYNHPRLGECRDVRTSMIKQKFENGDFETVNTIYKRLKAEIQ